MPQLFISSLTIIFPFILIRINSEFGTINFIFYIINGAICFAEEGISPANLLKLGRPN